MLLTTEEVEEIEQFFVLTAFFYESKNDRTEVMSAQLDGRDVTGRKHLF